MKIKKLLIKISLKTDIKLLIPYRMKKSVSKVSILKIWIV